MVRQPRLDARELYAQAYPAQGENQLLAQMLENTVPKEEAEEIPDATILGVLSLFGNDDLAFVVSQAIEERNKSKNNAKSRTLLCGFFPTCQTLAARRAAYQILFKIHFLR